MQSKVMKFVVKDLTNFKNYESILKYYVMACYFKSACHKFKQEKGTLPVKNSKKRFSVLFSLY